MFVQSAEKFGASGWVRGVGLAAGAAGALLAAQVLQASAAELTLDEIRQEVPATFEGPTTAAKAPTGIKVAIIPCGVQFRGCNAPALGAAEAAEKLGWEVKSYDPAGSQDKQNTAILDAISAGSNLIITVSLDPNFIQLGLAKAKEAGIPVVSASAGTDSPNPTLDPGPGKLKYVLDVGVNYAELGRRLGQWIIADSGGKANLLAFTDEAYPSAVLSANAVYESVKNCAGCTVSEQLKFTASQIGTILGPMVVGYLQSHPEVNYVYAPYDPSAAAMANAIVQGGFKDRVKLISIVGAAQNIDMIRKGYVQVADGAYDNFYMGWAAVDQAIRVLNKQPVIEPNGEGTPFIVIDKTNLPPEGEEWATKTDYRSIFLKLWQ